jgi:hypothetical protein
MSKQLNIDEILDKHCPDIENMVNISKKDIKSAIKEIVEQYTEIVVENADIIKIDGPVDEESIRDCLKLVKYELE